ncbi:hypothetical protein V8C26DRAFT_424595 [Trichoderma gracile]
MAGPLLLFVQLFTLLALTLGTSSLAADRPRANYTSIFPRGKDAKQEIFFHCSSAPAFKPYLQDAFVDAEQIVGNAVKALDLLISMFEKDGSGNLLPNKRYKAHRTFDEDNVFSSYSFFIYRLADPRRPDRVKDAYQAFNTGQVDPGAPNLEVYCDETEWLHERRLDGRSYLDCETILSLKNPRLLDDGRFIWYIARMASPNSPYAGQRRFAAVEWVCPLDALEEEDEPGTPPARRPARPARFRQFGNLHILVAEGLNGYVTSEKELFKDQAMTICPAYHQIYIDRELENIGDGLDLQRLHVPHGASPTLYQKEAGKTLVEDGYNTVWLGSWLVATVIHELGHAKAFTPGRILIDVECKHHGEASDTASNVNCLYDMAKGVDGLDESGAPQGHMDAGEMLMNPCLIFTLMLTTALITHDRGVCYIRDG